MRNYQNGGGQRVRRRVSIDLLLQNFFVDHLPAGHPTHMPPIDAIKRVAGENTSQYNRRQSRRNRERIVKPYEKRPFYSSGGIVPGETTDDTRTIARLLLPLAEEFHPVPNEMKRRIVGILDDLDPIQVEDATKEVRKICVGQILQDHAFCTEPHLAQPVIPSPRLVVRTTNQNPEVIWVRDDGTEYRDRRVGSWRLEEGRLKVFKDRPYCPLSWIVPSLLDGYGSSSIKALAFVCLRQQVWLEAIKKLYAKLLESGGLVGYEVLPPSSRATPLPRPPRLIDPAAYELWFHRLFVDFGKIVVVHFSAEGAGPCKVVREDWSKYLASDDRFAIFHLNVDECVGHAISFAVTAVPTIMIYKGAHRVYRQVGAVDSREVRRLVELNAAGRA